MEGFHHILAKKGWEEREGGREKNTKRERGREGGREEIFCFTAASLRPLGLSHPFTQGYFMTRFTDY